MQKDLPISLFITKATKTECTSLIKHGDSLNLIFKVYDANGKVLYLTGKTVDLILKKQDKTIFENAITSITDTTETTKGSIPTTYTGSELRITLDEQTTNVIGVIQGELQIGDISGTIITNTFTLLVAPSLSDDIITVSGNDIQTLIELKATLESYSTNIELIAGTTESVEALADIKAYIDANLAALTTQNANSITNKSALDTSITNADALKTALDTSIANANSFVSSHGDIIDLDNRVTQNTQQLNGEHYLTYKSVAGSIGNTYTITDDDISACERMGTDICICPMASVTSATDYNVLTLVDSKITECLDRIAASTVNPIMIKPHIGLNFQDNFNRKDYIPSNIPQFFTNWTNILLNYAAICDTYNIPLLCVSVEMVQLTHNDYASYWETLYNTINDSHPNVKIIHAPKVWEFNDNNHELSLQWADILGCTFYTNYSYKSFVGDTVNVLEDIGKAFYFNEYGFVKILNDRCSKYNKKFYIAEIGCMPLQDGLIDVIPKSSTEGAKGTNYYVQSALMEGFFKYLCSNSNIVGFSWWHLHDPFDIYSTTETLPGETMMTKYIKGGLL